MTARELVNKMSGYDWDMIVYTTDDGYEHEVTSVEIIENKDGEKVIRIN